VPVPAVTSAERRAALDNCSDAKATVVVAGKQRQAVNMSMLRGSRQGPSMGDDETELEGDLFWQAVGGVAPEFIIVQSRQLFLGFWKECQAAIGFMVMYSWCVEDGMG